MTIQEIQQFLEARPSLSKAGFCREADISPQYLGMIFRGDRPLTSETIERLEPVMKLYGWSKNK